VNVPLDAPSLRQHSRIPFSTHVPGLRRAVALGAPDTFVCNFASLGGLSKTLKFIAACEAMGNGFWCYSNDLGIMTAAYLHVSAATQWINEASQSLFRWQVGDVIKDGPFRQTNNMVKVPDGPGAGDRTRSGRDEEMVGPLYRAWPNGAF